MKLRVALLLALFAGLLGFAPSWIVPDWSDPGGWLSSARPEDAAAAGLRSLAIALAGTQLAGLSLLWVSAAAGSGSLERLARRALLPMFRTTAPIMLAAGSALPAVAMETRLPIQLPPTERSVEVASIVPASVVVESGDSMWTIAAGAVDGDPSRYWRRVVDLNVGRFADVDLIHPGDIVLLPPVNPGR